MSNSAYAPVKPDYLSRRDFFLVMAVAVLLHLAAICGWRLLPRTPVTDIPVHVLNIKLGDSDALESPPPPPPVAVAQETGNSEAVEDTISRMVRPQSPPGEAREQAVTKSIDKAMSSHPASNKPVSPSAASELDRAVAPTADAAKQFVRENHPPPAAEANPSGKGSVIGNSTGTNAEMMSRYEQMISLWIQKFKLYPEEARAQRMQGETVVRVRIDRRGNIRYYALERTTGHRVLDRAAIDMIRRANPVPAVPNNYPEGDLLEFLIPVSFKLQ